MTNKIGMNVEARFDTNGINQGLQQVEQKINQVNRNPVSPVSDKSIKQLDELNKRFQQLLKVDGELRRRIKATGQEGKLFEDIDWASTHPDKAARNKKLNSVNEYLGAGRGVGGLHPPPPKNEASGGFKDVAVGAAQAGLRATGSAGGVAANALGTGMSAGAGAGLMGLLGGIAALGVSKVVGSVMEKMEQAEANNVAFDRLKRTLGDVNVSFNGLKAAVSAGSEKLKITYDEFGQLSTQFAKAGNMKDSQYKTLPDEIGLGVGMSRAFGLDPSQGVGFMGSMRGMGITSDMNESRKFALLIGETIGKSGAFAKADEVMQAIGSYAESQTRNSMSRANVAGYGGMYSSMVGSGMPGMDPSSAASLLNRINASLSAGGAKGEASQFFTAMVGNKMGLDPLRTQVMREGGMFATNNGMFGKDSAYARYMGKSGPTGSATFLQGTIDTLNQQYGGNSDDQKLLRAQAFANHTGINMNQSMAMLSLKPNQMGDMEKYAGDLTKLSGSGIGNLAKVVTGTDADRRSVSESLMRRSDVTDDEKERLSRVMATGSQSEQKEMLAALVASRDQERTTGSDIRDSKNALDNIKTAMADKLVPLTLEMRHGIMSIAGADKGKSPREIMETALRAEGKDKLNSVEQKYGASIKVTEAQLDLIKKKKENLKLESRKQYGSLIDKPEEVARMMKQLSDEEAAAAAANTKAKEEYTEAMKKATQEIEDGVTDSQLGLAPGTTSKQRMISGGGSGGGAVSGTMDPKKREEAMQFFMSKGWTKEQAAGIVANLQAESKMDPTAFNPAGGGKGAAGLAQWRGSRQTDFAQRYGKNVRDGTFQEQLDFTHYELTEGKEKAAGNLVKSARTARDAGRYVSDYYERHGGSSDGRAALAEKLAGTPMPTGAGAGRGDDPRKFTVSSEPIVVLHKDEKGRDVRPSQSIQTRVAPATPFGR